LSSRPFVAAVVEALSVVGVDDASSVGTIDGARASMMTVRVLVAMARQT
jgi:hypothetical protein